MVKFSSKLREIDRRYERENNSQQDNGVYFQAAQHAKQLSHMEKRTEQGASLSHKPSVVGSVQSTLTSSQGLDRSVLKKLEEMGYEKSYLISCLTNNELNNATTAYYLLLEA